MIPVVDMLYKEKIRKGATKAILANGSEFWEEWKAPTVPVHMRFFLFNVTNPQAVKDGGKPMLTERGPYTYKEERKKEDIVFNENGTVTYRERRTYFFQRDMSVGDDTDLVTTGNLPLMAAADLLQYALPVVRGIVSLALTRAKQDLFVTRSVKDLLWGYTDENLERLQRAQPDWVPTAFVGYFIHRNNTDTGLMNVFTGKNNVDNLGQIDKYNDSKALSFWSTRWANMINGTDGTLFPPFQQGREQVKVFSTEICRSMNAVYEKTVETDQGISVRRFVAAESNLQNASANPDNLGFCTPQTRCLPTGLLNLTNCLIGWDNVSVPAVGSLPHFYQADPVVRNSVDGLQPSPDLHQTVLDIEPWTGLVLRAYRRLQINMHIKKLDGLVQTYNIRTLVFPILWISESMEIDDSHATQMQRNLFAPLGISSVLEKVFLILGGALFLISMIIVCRNRQKNKLAMTATLPPGPVPNKLANGTRGRRAKRSSGAHPTKEAVPLLADHHRPGGGGGDPPSPPPPPVPSYQRPPLSNGAHHHHHHHNQHSVAASMEPMYQTALDA